MFDRPILQWVIEEAVASGTKDVVLVTGEGKESLEAHFAPSPELEAALAATGKLDLLKTIQRISSLVNLRSVRQDEPKGLGHAVWTARDLVKQSDYFGVMLADDLVDADNPGLKQLVDFQTSQNIRGDGAGVVMLMEVPEKDVSKYGICEFKSASSGLVSRAVEKPMVGTTSSRMAIVARYLLPRGIMEILEKCPQGPLGEIQLTDALNTLAERGKLYGYVLKGQRFDAGDRMGLLKANVHYYLKSELGPEVSEWLRELKLKN